MKSQKFNSSRFREGTFVEFWAFCARQKLSITKQTCEEDDAVTMVSHRFPHHEIARDESGRLGVKIWDQDDSEYRIREAVSEQVSATKVEFVGNKDEMEHLIKHKSSKFSQVEVAGADGDGESDLAASPQRVVVGDCAGDLACSRDQPSSRRRVQKKRSFDAFGATSGTPTRPVVASSPGLDDDKCQGDDEHAATSKRKRRTATQVIIDSTEDALKAFRDKWSFASHWDGKARRRDYDNFINRLNSVGRKSGALYSSEPALALSGKAFAAVEKLERRQVVFDSIRADIANWVLCDLHPHSAEALREAEPSFLLGMMVGEFNKRLSAPFTSGSTLVVKAFFLFTCSRGEAQTHLQALACALCVKSAPPSCSRLAKVNWCCRWQTKS